MQDLPLPFSVQLHRQGDRVVLALYGEFDLAGAPEARACVRRLAGPRCRLIVDLRGLSFIDSSGVAVLIEAAARARSNGWELGIVPSEHADVRGVFRITGLEEHLPFVSAAEASVDGRQAPTPEG